MELKICKLLVNGYGKIKGIFNNIIRHVPIKRIDRTLEMMSDAPESTLRQTMLVRITSDTHKIQSSDWSKRRYMCYDVTLYSAFCRSIGLYFKRSVNTLIDRILKQRTELN